MSARIRHQKRIFSRKIRGGLFMAGKQPLRDYILARPVKAETKTASGLYIPENSAEKSNDAVVKAIGKDVKDIKVNDVITYKSYSTIELKAGADELILVKEEDVAATER
jgi:chaperonin GroES